MPNQLFRDLATLVGFQSVSHLPLNDLADWVADQFEHLGFRIESFPDASDPGKRSLICTIGPNDIHGGLVLSGHMDVVPTEGQPWSTDPFTVTERDGRLYGRGTADMKGFFASTLSALRRLRGHTFKRQLVLVWTHDEEIGCLGSKVLCEELVRLDRALPTAALIGEPTSFEILRMHPGHVALQLTVKGKAAHSSRPDLGSNAIAAAANAVVEAEKLARALATERADIPELSRPVVAFNTAIIEGGGAINIVPDQCIVRFGYRPLPGMDPTVVYERLVEAWEHAQLGLPWESEITRITPSMLTKSGTKLERILHGHSHSSTCGAASFATDGGNLAKLGLKPLIFGPGSIEVAHKADEYIEATELINSVDMLEDIIRKFCL